MKCNQRTSAKHSSNKCDKECIPGLTKCFEHADKEVLYMLVQQQQKEIERLERALDMVAEAF